MAIYLPGNVERDFQAPDEFTTTLGDYTSAKFQEGLESNPVQLFKDMYKFQEANAPTQPRLKPDEIKARTEQEGVDVEVPADGLSQLALDIMIDRKKRQKKLSEAIDNSPTGFRSLAGLGASLGAGLLDPLNVGLSFVPVVGQARYASMIARQSGMLGRVSVRAGVGAVEGAVGTAIIEPFMYGMHQTLQDDYDAVDSLLNIGLGSVLGGGLHVVGGAGVDAYKKWRTSDGLDPLPPKVDAPLENTTPTNALEPIKTDAPISQPQPNANALPDVATARLDPNSAAAVTEFATPQTREAALRSAVGQIVEGKQVDVESAFKADPKGVATQTDLPAFKAWFGESKVVDADGAPAVVYHGTKADFDNFDTSISDGRFGQGAYFTNDASFASGFADAADGGGSVVPAYLSMKNPFVVTNEYMVPSTAELKNQGFDGVVYTYLNKDNKPTIEYVVFDPRQIKSAIGNSGAFDPNSGSLTDQLTSTIQRQASPESVRVADFEGAKAADEKLATAPKSEALQDAEAELARVMKDLEERLGVPAEKQANKTENVESNTSAVPTSKSGNLLREWINQTMQPNALRGPNAAADVFRLIDERAKFSNADFMDGFKQSDVGLYDFEIRDVPLSKLSLIQEGEDRLNDSSRETAQQIKKANKLDDLSRREDVLPILLDEDWTVMDGHHRYTAAELNGETTIPALVPVGEGTGKVLNIEAYANDGVVATPTAEAPKETARPAKKSRAKEDTLLTRLQKMGGISITERMDVTGNNFAPGGYNPVFKKDSKVSLKGAIESGSLDDFLPYEMRLSSSPDEAFDATEAYDYLAEKIRNGEKVIPYEAELQQKFEAYMSELVPYDEAIQAADELSLAARAAAICDLRG